MNFDPRADSNGQRVSEFEPLADKRTLTLANAFLRWAGYAASTGESSKPLTLWSWRQEFYVWNGNVYHKVLPETFAADVSKFLDQQHVARKVRGGFEADPLDASPKLVDQVVKKISLLCQASIDQMPAWLDRARPDPSNVIAFENGWIDVAKYLTGEQGIQNPPNPYWFSEHVIPYRYDSTPSFHCPEWLRFVDNAFCSEDAEDTRECIQLLQQWCGYCLTPDTRHQNMMWFWGPPGTGKSVTAGILRDMIGVGACDSPTLSELGDKFGKESLLGKTNAIIADAHLGWKSDSAEVVNTIKGVTGGDPMNVGRKYLKPLSGVRLPIRFTLGINLLPSLRDDSSAIRRRMLVLPFEHIHDGLNGRPKPDRDLPARIRTELPEIVKWALEGLRTLRLQQGFHQPECANWIINDMIRMGSPVECFIQDKCVRVSQDLWSSTESLYKAYRSYAAESGRDEGGSIEKFGSALKGIGFKKVRPHEDGDRVNAYRGIMLRSEVPT